MTTLATCWKITRRDETVEGYTDHDADLRVEGVTYVSAAGYAPSSVERSSSMQADNQDVVGIINNDNLTVTDLLSGAYDGARVEVMLVDWQTRSVETKLIVGHFGQVKVANRQYTVTLHSIEAELSKPIGRAFGLRCDAELGDARCGYGLTADAGTVASVTTARRVWVDTGRIEADDYYVGGKVKWLTGANAGRVMDVKQHKLDTQTVELFEPMASDIEPGDTYEISRGCDKAFVTCRDVFDNALNFRGFPYIPGVSDLISGES
jgi:uncharacterized phage protein (TIGR02218 family)